MEKLKILGSSIFMLAIAAFLAWYNGPDLLHDVQHMGDETEYAQAHEFIDGECSTQLVVFALCDMQIANLANGNATQDIKYMMLSGPGDIELDVLEYADGTVTTSLGVEGLWNRIGLFVLFVGGFFIAGFLTLLKVFKSPQT